MFAAVDRAGLVPEPSGAAGVGAATGPPVPVASRRLPEPGRGGAGRGGASEPGPALSGRDAVQPRAAPSCPQA